MLQYDYLLLITVLTAMTYFISFCIISKPIYRIGLGLLVVSIFIYCGIGTTFYDIKPIYLIYYMIFIVASSVTFVFSIKVRLAKVKKKNNNFDNFISNNTSILTGCTWALFILTIANLVYPEMRITKLFSFDLFNIIDIFERREALRENAFSYIVNLLKLNLFPFFLMYLYHLKKKDKKILAVTLLLAWIYMDFTILGYISRYQMVILGLLLFLIYFEENGIINKKAWIIFGICFLLSIPMLLAYEQIREGIVNSDRIGFTQSVEALFKKECDYPKYYSIISESNLKGMASEYFIWLFTLPIPKKILYIDVIQINDIFTLLVTGKERFQPGFSIVLPSLLGEGIMIYGERLFWIHGIVVGLLSGFFIKFIERFKYLRFWNYYFIVNLLTIARGGSQGVFANIINSMIFLLLFTFIIKLVGKAPEQKEYYSE